MGLYFFFTCFFGFCATLVSSKSGSSSGHSSGHSGHSFGSGHGSGRGYSREACQVLKSRVNSMDTTNVTELYRACSVYDGLAGCCCNFLDLACDFPEACQYLNFQRHTELLTQTCTNITSKSNCKAKLSSLACREPLIRAQCGNYTVKLDKKMFPVICKVSNGWMILVTVNNLDFIFRKTVHPPNFSCVAAGFTI
uniref:Uncharacterized protein n=1 Tax=Ditylenchus dipsaci TaxID=166011 RepID=A0A915DPF7_9BILA